MKSLESPLTGIGCMPLYRLHTFCDAEMGKVKVKGACAKSLHVFESACSFEGSP